MIVDSLSERIATIQAEIVAAAQRVGRDPAEITLLAVSKTHPVEAIQAAIDAGLRHFGENRVQEAEGKKLELTRQDIHWHLIGQLQRNKARRAVHLFDLIHSVESMRLAEALSRIVEEEQHDPIQILLEVNVAGDAAKSGFELRDGIHNPRWAEFVDAVATIVRMPGLAIQGLMTIPPFDDDLEGIVRPCFRGLREVRDALQAAFPTQNWRHLSMGMSGDFAIAIEEGATIVRVGTALFGQREYKER